VSIFSKTDCRGGITIHVAGDLHLRVQPSGKISAALSKILKNQGIIMIDLNSLKAAVAASTAVEQSAILLLQGLKAKLDAALTDPAALQALSDEIGANTAALAAAIVANTPAA
jgi:hypothetical protein